MSVIMYGIPNCDTIKKAKKWLEANGIDYEFHNYKKEGISKAKLKDWCKQVDWEILLNRRGTTWRKLDDATKEGINKTSAIGIMTAETSIIKRPVIETDDMILVGFFEDEYKSTFKI